jgi:hypothetical protein
MQLKIGYASIVAVRPHSESIYSILSFNCKGFPVRKKLFDSAAYIEKVKKLIKIS